MTWLGYPDTTGITAIDYRITDALADPPPFAETVNTEALLRIDPLFLCYRGAADSPSVNAREGEADVVFGSFNALAKVNAHVIETWARILQAVPRSRLLLKASVLKHAQTRARVMAAFESQGVARDRIDLRAWADDRAGHLGTYHEVDIALDTFPYNGTTTTCEALWMGVPVVGLRGEAHMSRVGTSLLTSAGLVEFVAANANDYVEIAVALARENTRRSTLRSEMRARLCASPLLDHAGFVRRFERELRRAWSRWCEHAADTANARF
jgi:predicted O-linked N-acetylglucosamine transferase (SPINDLY family)